MFKEFFTGGFRVQDARKTIEALDSRDNLSRRQQARIDAAIRITRRHSLKLLGTGLGLAAAVTTPAAYFLLKNGGQGVDSEEEGFSSILPQEAYIERPLLAKKPRHEEPDSNFAFDLEHVNKLLIDLQKPMKKDIESTWHALMENVAYVQLLDLGGVGNHGEGTALRICESGYYLTAAHFLIENRGSDFVPIKTKAQVYLPTLGSISPIKTMIFDPTCDLAIFFAPTGKAPKKIQDLQLSTAPLIPGQKLWQLGIKVETPQNTIQARLGIPYGSVDQNPKEKNYLGEETYIKVRGMIPYGGSSGAPIIDSIGNIVAVESGFLIDTADDQPIEKQRRNYTHSIVSPLRNLQRLNGAKIQTLAR